MANDLSDLDHLSPGVADLVSLGDDAIRETRQKIKNWGAQDLGNTNAEHYNDGPHRFTVSSSTTPPGYAGLPVIGHVGRIAIDTNSDGPGLLVDNGTTWVPVKTVGLYSQTAGAATPGVGAYATMSNSITITAHIGQTLIIGGSAFYLNAGAQTLKIQATVGGVATNVRPTEWFCPVSTAGATEAHAFLFSMTVLLSAGTTAVALQAKVDAGVAGTIVNSYLNVLVI